MQAYIKYNKDYALLDRFAAVMYVCALKWREYRVPYAVSLVTDEHQTPSNVLNVLSYPTGDGPEVNFTVCVTPLNHRFDDYRRVIETIELNRMFGADRFVFYNYSTGSLVTEALDSYGEESDIVWVIPWHIPVKVKPDPLIKEKKPPSNKEKPPEDDDEVHYYAQVAALHDCLYRNMFRSRFIVFTDLDEVIVPRRVEHRNWMALIDALTADGSKRAGAFYFRNTFFRTDWPNDTRAAADEQVAQRRIYALLTTHREIQIYFYHSRSKYIVRPELVLTVGIHIVGTVMDNNVEIVYVNEVDGLLHHYRDCRDWYEKPMLHDVPGLSDRYMHRFYDDIVNRVTVRDSHIDTCIDTTTISLIELRKDEQMV